MSCWQLRTRIRGDLVIVQLDLLVDGAVDNGVAWHLAVPVTVGREREALTCARLVSAASGGPISRWRVLRRIEHAAMHADWRSAA